MERRDTILLVNLNKYYKAVNILLAGATVNPGKYKRKN
jgi:hypothetical protein